MANARGWVVGSGLPDEARAGARILRDYTAGSLLYYEWPPGHARVASGNHVSGLAITSRPEIDGLASAGGAGSCPVGGGSGQLSAANASGSSNQRAPEPIDELATAHARIFTSGEGDRRGANEAGSMQAEPGYTADLGMQADLDMLQMLQQSGKRQ